MDRARSDVVCDRDGGAPASLAEYMLAWLPVLANAELARRRQYILPETGMLAARNIRRGKPEDARHRRSVRAVRGRARR